MPSFTSPEPGSVPRRPLSTVHAPRRSFRLEAVFTHAAEALGAAFVLTFLVMAILRLAYPHEVTWLESAMYVMMKRLAGGRSPYGAPSLDDAPCLYPPLYFHLAALLARLRGVTALPDFVPLRLVSASAALGVFATLAFVLRVARQRPWRVALLHAAFWLALQGRFEGWLDASRVDSLYTLLLLLAVVFVFEGTGWLSAALAGVFAGAAMLTKQPAALLWLLALFVELVRRRDPARVAVAVLGAALLATTYLVATGELHNPAFFFWLFVVPASHPLRAGLFARGFVFVGVTMTPWLLLGLAPARRWLAAWRRRDALATLEPWSATLWLWLPALFLLRAKEGASINFFLPLAPVLALGAALAPFERWRPWQRPALALLQFAILLYDPRPLTPTPTAVREVDAFVARLRALPGDVWIPAFPSYAVAAGKPWHAHVTALADLRHTSLGPALAASLAALPADRAFVAWMPDPGEPLVPAEALVHARTTTIALPPFESVFLRRLHDGHLPANLNLRSNP